MKYSRLHIILTIVSGLVLSVSCSTDRDIDLSAAEKADEMAFEVGDATRAQITHQSNLSDNPFKLFGNVNTRNEYYTEPKVIFGGTKVSYINNKWDYGASQYWLMGEEHSFVAIHPYDVPGLEIVSYSDSKLTFTYEIPVATLTNRVFSLMFQKRHPKTPEFLIKSRA